MASKEFEVQQLLKAYRKGIISEDLFAKQMAEIAATANGQGGAAMSAGNGQGAATTSPQAAPTMMRGVTGDASIDGGAMLTAMREKKTYDRAAEDLGNIVALEHVNVTVPDQEKATLFYVNGLGLTRDPYMMTGPANMWVNVGRQQFHLPTGKPQVVRGHVGVVVSDCEALPRRLGRVREALAGTRFECHERDGYVEASALGATVSVATHRTSVSARCSLVSPTSNSTCRREQPTESHAFIRRSWAHRQRHSKMHRVVLPASLPATGRTCSSVKLTVQFRLMISIIFRSTSMISRVPITGWRRRN